MNFGGEIKLPLCLTEEIYPLFFFSLSMYAMTDPNPASVLSKQSPMSSCEMLLPPADLTLCRMHVVLYIASTMQLPESAG